MGVGAVRTLHATFAPSVGVGEGQHLSDVAAMEVEGQDLGAAGGAASDSVLGIRQMDLHPSDGDDLQEAGTDAVEDQDTVPDGLRLGFSLLPFLVVKLQG